MQIVCYTPEMADAVADLVATCLAPYRQQRPMSLLTPPSPWASSEELLETLTSPAVCTEASHVAVRDGRPVSAALAVQSADCSAWWRIATAPAFRRQGLASACVQAGEDALREAGQRVVATDAVVDSRWAGAGELLTSLGYCLDDPERRNITMIAENWTPRPVSLCEGYTIETLRVEELAEWMEARNAVFGGDSGPEWFEERFLNRPDFDPQTWFIARHSGRIIGIASALCIEHERDPQTLRGGQIEWVGVLDAHRGKRLGEELVVACLNAISERGFLPALLLTQPFRVPAVKLYEKLGFRTVAGWQRWTKPLA